LPKINHFFLTAVLQGVKNIASNFLEKKDLFFLKGFG
jgi:hypothetical protein